MVRETGGMIIQYAPDVIKKLERLDVRIRKSFRKKIQIFEKNQYNSQLNNHTLKREYKRLRSIDITADYRAIYEEVNEGEETIIYSSLFGTHKELYG